MGTASVAADVFRSPELKAPSGARDVARNSDNRFNDYLEEARAAKPKRDTERADDSRKVEEADARDAQASDAVTASTEDAEQALAEEVAAANASVESALIALPEGTTLQGGDSAQLRATSDVQVPQSLTTRQSASQQATSNSPTTFEQAQATDPTRGEAQSSNADTRAVTASELLKAGDATSDQAKTNALSNATSKPAQVTNAPAQNSDTSPTAAATEAKRTTANQLPNAERPTENARLGQDADRQVRQFQRDGERITQPQVSLFDQKVAAAKTAERLGQAEYIVPGAAGNQKAGQVGNDQTQSAAQVIGDVRNLTGEGKTVEEGAKQVGGHLSRVLAEAFGSADDNAPTGSIRSAKGDGAALSTFRLLTEGAIDPSRVNVGNNGSHAASEIGGSGTSGAQAAEPRGVASPTNAGQIVGQLLSASVEKSDGAEALARLLNASSVPGRHQATLRLDPPELGQVNIRIDLKHEGLTLQVNTESRDVARLLESRLTDLREALATHGIRIERTDVVVQTNASHHANLHDSTSDDRQDAAQYDDSQSSNENSDSQFAQESNDSDEQIDSPRVSYNNTTDGAHHDERDAALELTNDDQLLSETAVNLVA